MSVISWLEFDAISNHQSTSFLEAVSLEGISVACPL